MNHIRKIPLLSFVTIAVSLLAACSSKPQFGAVVSEMISNDTYDIQVKLQVSDKLNPNPEGRPSPLVLQIFQLKDDSKFSQASIDVVLSNPDLELGADLIKVDQTMAFPGKSKEYVFDVNSEAKFLGVVASFQKEDGKAKQLIDIEGHWSRDICITLSDTSLTKAERC